MLKKCGIVFIRFIIVNVLLNMQNELNTDR